MIEAFTFAALVAAILFGLWSWISYPPFSTMLIESYMMDARNERRSHHNDLIECLKKSEAGRMTEVQTREQIDRWIEHAVAPLRERIEALEANFRTTRRPKARPSAASLHIRPPSPSSAAIVRPSREELAETIHNARWPADRQLMITPFADEDTSGRTYCFRLADAVLAAHFTSVAQGPTEPLQCLRCGTVDAFGPVSKERVRASWQCVARKQGTPGGNAPADCDWPGCGCDPAASKVLEAIDEAGFDITPRPLIQKIEAEARRYAEMYPQSSDGRNTFVIFADWVAALALSSTDLGCGDPNCRDPNCTYGKGPNRDPLSSPHRGPTNE